MLRWSMSFIILAVVSAIIGFTKVASVFSEIYQILFLTFILIFLLSLLIDKLFFEK